MCTRGEGLWFRAGEGCDQRGDGPRVDGAGGEAMASRKASWLPEVEEGTTSAAMRTAAALSRTTSRRGPGSPAKMERRGWRRWLRRRPRAGCRLGAEERPTCSGVRAIEGDGVAANLGELGWAGDGELVDARAACVGFFRDCAVDDEGVADAEQEHGLGDDGEQAGGVDTHDLGARSGGVGQRAEDVECGAHAEGAADGHDGLHGRMQAGSVEEGEAVAAQGGGPGGGGERDGDAEGFEDIGRAAKGCDGAVAVLGDCSPGGGGDQGGGGGDVEGSGVVSTGAAGVNEERALGVVEGDGDCCGEHGFGESGQLGGGLAAGGDGPEQRGELEGVWAAGLIGIGAAGQNEIEQGARLAAREEFTLLDDALHVFMQGHEGKGIRRGRLRGNGFPRSRFEIAGRHAAFAR